MFAKAFALFTISLFAAVAAVPTPGGQPATPSNTTVSDNGNGNGSNNTNVSECNTGSMQCCNTLEAPSAGEASSFEGLFGVVAQGLIGKGCTALSSGCTAQPACCSNVGNGAYSLISIECSPISLI